jgi:hypothetical protein
MRMLSGGAEVRYLLPAAYLWFHRKEAMRSPEVHA